MLVVAYTPRFSNSRGFREIENFLREATVPQGGNITLPDCISSVRTVFDNDDGTARRIVKELSKAKPRKAVVVDATYPHTVSPTFKTLIGLIGQPGFSADDLAERFYFVTLNTYGTGYVLNGLLTKEDSHLRSLLESPLHG